MTGELLKVDNLSRHFKIGNALSRRTLHAVDDVNFAIGDREIVALAGESGVAHARSQGLTSTVLAALPDSVT